MNGRAAGNGAVVGRLARHRVVGIESLLEMPVNDQLVDRLVQDHGRQEQGRRVVIVAIGKVDPV